MKFGRKDFQLAFKTGTDANKAKFKKECVQGEIYHATDTGFFYVAEVTAGASDATLSKFGATAFQNQHSISLDGTNDIISISSTPTYITQSSAFSLSFFMNPLSYGSHGTYANVLALKSDLNSKNFAIHINNNVAGYAGISFGITDYNINTASYHTTGVTGNTLLNTWSHVVITYNGSGLGTIGNWKIYINGSSKTIGTGGGWFDSGTPTNVIGNYRNYHYEGLIDELAVFNSELSSSNVTSIYNSGTPTDISSLSPVGWWRMGDNNSGSGTTITDQGSGGNDGTLTNGPTFSTDVPEYVFSRNSVSFDGSDDYLTTNQSSLATSGDCTISLWFNSASLPGSGAYDYMFSLTDGRATGKDRAIGILGTGSDAQILANTYASGWNLPFTNTSISADTWYHVAVIFTTNNAQVYLNGVDKGSKTLVASSISYTQTIIGGMLYSSANYFNGKIDEVSVFHSALSSSNIATLYNGGVPGDISSLTPKGWWRNGDGTGDTDSGGGAPGNTDPVGTIVNQGSVNTGSGEGNMTGTNGPTFSTDVPT